MIRTVHDVQDLETSFLSSRSRLYHLKPIGIDTPHVENLTSYIIRLAEEHCVLPKALIIKEVLPLLTQTGELEEPIHYSYGAVLGNAQALNGMGIMATSGVHALEKLTQWKGLHLLTMLPWANVISKYGLCRETQAWCPLCFEEWRTDKCVIYTPLLWSLKAVRVCLHHKRLLHEKCPSLQCNKTVSVLHPNIRSGYCPYCSCWLGNSTDMGKIAPETVMSDEFEREVWYATALGELLEVAPRPSSTLQKEDLVLAVDYLINRMPVKKAAYLTRQLGRKSVQTVALWQKGLEIPRMNTLLQMCHLLDISLQQLFLRVSDGELFTISEEHKKFNREMVPVRTKKPHDPEELRRALETVLASDEEPFPSITEVAQRLGYCNRSSLYKRFPELAYSITAKYQKNRKSHPEQKMSSDELRQALERILSSNEEPPPTIQEVAHRLGYRGVSTLYSRFPDLSHAITAKYQRYHPGRREPMDAEVLRQSLEAILASNEEPPPSIREVALRLGYRSETSLYYLFPELTHRIVAKHRKHTSHYKERISLIELQQALEAVLVSEEEPFPSIHEVARRLGYRSEGTLYKRFPDLSHAIAVKHRKHTSHYKEKMSSIELQQALEAVLASEEEPPLSVPEVAQRLGYRSERTLYKRFPDLSRSIAERYHKYRYNREEIMNLDDLRQALEVVLASEEEQFPSMNEVARFLGYRYPAFLYKHFPNLSRAITLQKGRSENLPQKLALLLQDAAPTITQQEIAKQLGCSIPKLHRHFPELSSILKQRFIQSFDLEAVQATLEKELATEGKVRSLSAVARDLGYPVRTLTKFFPSLCQRIIVRGQLYRKEHNALRKQKIQEEVKRVVLAINADQQYPSLAQMLKRIDRSCVHPPIYYLEAYVPWKKALESLGY